MSQWYEAKKDDIEIDYAQKEINIYVTQNDWGSVNLTLTFDQIKEIHDEITNKVKI